MAYIFRNAYLVSEGLKKDFSVRDGKMGDPREDAQDLTGAEAIDLGGRLVIAGFVDGHMHLDKAFINEKLTNRSGTLEEAISLMSRYKAEMTVEDIKERAEKTLRLSYRNGTRFIRTHVDVDDRIRLKSVEALLELREEWKDRIRIQIVAFPQEGIVDKPGNYQYVEEALRRGVDLVGGMPANDSDPVRHIEMIFELAKRYDVDIDMHIDETDDPESLTLRDLCKATIAHGYQGRVTADHCCSLSAISQEAAAPIMDLAKEAGVSVVTLPSTNLYLQGRGDTKNIRRGITRVSELLERGVPVVLGSDNVRDPFNPFGNGNLLEIALIAAHGCHMGGQEDLETLFDMATVIPKKVLGFEEEMETGKPLNLVVLDSTSKLESIITQSGIYGYLDENSKFVRTGR
jgi:cytosine deaminase